MTRTRSSRRRSRIGSRGREWVGGDGDRVVMDWCARFLAPSLSRARARRERERDDVGLVSSACRKRWWSSLSGCGDKSARWRWRRGDPGVSSRPLLNPRLLAGSPSGCGGGNARWGAESVLSRVWGVRGEGASAMMLVGTRVRIGRGGGAAFQAAGIGARGFDGGVAIRGFRRGASSTPGYWLAALRAGGAIATGSGGFVAGPLNPRLLAGSPSGCGCDRDRFQGFRRGRSSTPGYGRAALRAADATSPSGC